MSSDELRARLYSHPRVPPHDKHFRQYRSGKWYFSMMPDGPGHIKIETATEHRYMISCCAYYGWMHAAGDGDLTYSYDDCVAHAEEWEAWGEGREWRDQ